MPSGHAAGPVPSTSIIYQAQNNMPQVFGRKSSRNSSSLRKISQPEETIHFSSEKDERAELTTTDPFVVDKTQVNLPVESDEAKIQKYFKLFNSIIIYLDVAQSELHITNKSLMNENDNSVRKLYTRVKLPKLLLKSTFAEYITRSSLRLKVKPPITAKTPFNWTIQFQDMDIEIVEDNETFPVLKPWQNTLTVATTKRKQAINPQAETDQNFKSQQRTTSPRVKTQRSDLEQTTPAAETSTVSSNSLKEIFSGSEHSPPPSPNLKLKSTMENPPNNGKFEEIVCLNLHLDSSAVHFYCNNVKILKEHLEHFMSVIEMSQKVNAMEVSFDALRKRKTSNRKSPPALMILTASEEHQTIKEFMDLDTNSDVSALPAFESKWKYSLLANKIISRQHNDAIQKRFLLYEIDDNTW